MKKKLLVLLLAMVTALSMGALAACSSGGGETPAEETPTEEPAATTDETTSADTGDSGETLEIVALLYSRGFEFMVALDQGIQDAAKESGVNISVLDGNSDSQTQISQIEDSITKGVDAIILSPNNSEELVPGVQKANEAGIPVITVDAVIGEGADVASAVAFDNAEGGKVAAQYIIDTLKEGEVLEVTGAQGAYHANMRGGGFNEGMATDSNFKVLTKDAGWLAENAQNITADVVTANPSVNAIFSHNGEMVRGIIAGLKQLGKTAKVGEDGHMMVVGIDGTPIELDFIRSGELDATVQQDPFDMGATALNAAVDTIKGNSVEKEIFMPPTLITKDNVDDPNLWGNKVGQ
jgi:ribose transport system substrate-binding protein